MHNSEVMILPKYHQLALAHRILPSLEPEMDAEIESAWDTEIRERIRNYDDGLTTGVSGQEVFAELEKKLQR